MQFNLKKQNIIQLTLTIAIILLICFISSFVYHRFDLTSEKRYTLSPESKEVLKNLDDVVFIKIYLDGDMPIGFKKLQNSIKDLLDEFRVVSKDNLQYEFINPSEKTDKDAREKVYEDLYNKGLQPTNVQVKDKNGANTQQILFPGAIVNYKSLQMPINFLKNNQSLTAEENLNNSLQGLEYELINCIKSLSAKKIQKVAFLEGHGELDQYQVADITRELANYYQVDRGSINALNCLDSYRAVIVANPQKAFSEYEKFVLDQYLMKGGKLLWLVNPVHVSMDSLSLGSSLAFVNSLNLDDQLFRYGVRINPNLIQDMQCNTIPVNTALVGEQPKWTPSPWLYFPILSPPDNNPISRNLNMLKSEFPSTIDTVGDDPAVRKTCLLMSSPYSKTISAPCLVRLSEITDKHNPYEFNKPNLTIGVLLEGKFQSAFKNRPLNNILHNQSVAVKPVSVPTRMIVISDGSMIRNDVRMSAQGPLISPLGYDKYTRQTFGNKEFILNAVNYLTDESGLMKLRSREIKLRLLDRQAILQERLKWQLINTLAPVLLVMVFGVFSFWWRRRKYTRF